MFRSLLRVLFALAATVAVAMAAFDAFAAIASVGYFTKSPSLVTQALFVTVNFLLNAWPELLVLTALIVGWRLLLRRWQTQPPP